MKKLEADKLFLEKNNHLFLKSNVEVYINLQYLIKQIDKSSRKNAQVNNKIS